MSLWTSYTSLSSRTRIVLGVALMANAALALQFSDQVEGFLGLTPTREDEQKLRESMPKVSLVDRENTK